MYPRVKLNFGRSTMALSLATLSALTLTGCNLLGQSYFDANFLTPALTNPVSPAGSPSETISTSYSFSATSSSLIQTGNDIQCGFDSCKIIPVSQIDRDGSAAGFGSASLRGLAHYGPLPSSSALSGISMGNDGTCDGSLTNCSTLSPDWTPKYSSIQGYWQFDGSGAINTGDSVPTSIGVSAISNNHAQYVSGQLRSGIEFSTSTILAVPKPAMLVSGANSLSFSVWVKRATNNASGAIIYRDAAYIMGVGVAPCAANQLKVTKYGVIDICIGSMPSDTLWHHVAEVASPSGVDVYIDGNLNGHSPDHQAFHDDSSRETRFGEGEGYFAGALDELAMWNVSLSAEEVRLIYDRQRSTVAGSFTSRIMGTALQVVDWSDFSWTSSLPYGKPLPDSTAGQTVNESSSNYPALVGSSGLTSDHDLMTQMIGLWHLDETELSTDGSGHDFKDNSPKNLWGTLVGNLLPADGILGRSLDASVGHVDLGPNALPDLEGTGSFTVSFWMNARESNFTDYEGLFARGTGTRSPWISTVPGVGGLQMTITTPSGQQDCSVYASTPITPHQWVHVVAVWDGNTGKFYLNGSADSAICSTLGHSLSPVNGTTSIGAGSSTYFRGQLDEVAVWKRVLNSAEIKQLYQRGASRIKFQVRTCSDSSCSSEPWQGPDQSDKTFFSELNNRTIQGLVMQGEVKTASPFVQLQNFLSALTMKHYFQYRAFLESDSKSPSLMPELLTAGAGPEHYSAADTVMITQLGGPYKKITSISETLGAAQCNSGIVYQLGVGVDPNSVNWYEWDAQSGTWTLAANNSPSAISITDLSSHVASFDAFLSNKKVYLKSFLRSDGSHGCELKTIHVSAQN